MIPLGQLRALAASLLLAGASACGWTDRPETTLSGQSPPGGSGAVVLPTTRCGDYFLVDALVDGQGPFRLLLDTGFPRTQLSPATAATLGARSSVDSIEAGAFRATGRLRIDVRDLDLFGLTLGTEIDGILGYTTFGSALLTYDFPAGEVRVSWDSLVAGEPGALRMARGERPFVYGRVGDDEIPLVLDTGFSGFLALADLNEYTTLEPPRVIGSRVRVDGVRPRHGARLAQDLVLGPVVMRTPVVVDAATSRSLLGQAFLRDYVVTLDRSRGLAQFRRPDGSPRAPVPDTVAVPPLRGSGMVLVPRADHYEVVDVVEGSAAERAGVQPGDLVRAVDGTPVDALGCRVRELADAPEPRRYTLERDAEQLEVHLTPGVLVG